MWLSINEIYEISVEGNIRNKKTGRILKSWIYGNYKAISLGANNKYYIHRLVAEKFLPRSTDICEVDHIDRNKFNNHASNLRWVSKSVNQQNKNLELKSRKGSSSGLHHIKFYSKLFIVCFKGVNLKHYSSHKTLVEAIKKRNEIINESIFSKEEA
jgi:hypothetical protein